MDRRLIWTERASSDIEAIVRYIARREKAEMRTVFADWALAREPDMGNMVIMNPPVYLGLVLCAAVSVQAADSVRILKQDQGAPPRLELQTQLGTEWRVEAGSDFLNWDLLTVFSAQGEAEMFEDRWAGGQDRRFYRVTAGDPAGLPVAPNFRLIDHDGKSRELHYYQPATEINGVVLIFTANGCSEVSGRLSALKALRAQYAQEGVLFWMINSKPGDTRTAIREEASALGITWPVLHDRSQVVARAYKVQDSPEVVVVQRDRMRLFYRGALDDGDLGCGLLGRALAELTGEARSVTYVKPDGCDLELPIEEPISYSTQIAPLLQAKCVSCHSPGNVAPWSMTSHQIVKQYAPVIEREVMARRMPPWHADPEYGRFSHDRSLAVEQERMLLQWVRAGAPRGEGPDPLENVPPPPPKWPEELGEPDLVVACPEQAINATGTEPYRYVYAPTGLSADVWLRAAIVRPSNRKVVHHYLVWEGQSSQQQATGIAGYVPGAGERPFPENTGVFMRAQSWVTFNLHYTPTGQPETDQPELALWFHDTPPAKALKTLPVLPIQFPIFTPQLDIPPGAQEHEVTVEFTLPFPVKLYRLSPHMHLRGSRMKFAVRYPNGTSEVLLSVPNYHFHWQTGYYLETPKFIPAQTLVTVTGAFDNSHLNPHNPDPNARVRWGDQSWDEMFIGYVDYTEE